MDVLFGSKDNHRIESLEFEVVDLESPYHALLGRPALAKFMATTHMAYLKMKMSGTNGIITVTGDYKRAMQCATVGSTLAESMVIQAEKSKMHKVVAMAKSAQLGVLAMTNPDGGATFEASKETKKSTLT